MKTRTGNVLLGEMASKHLGENRLLRGEVPAKVELLARA
jgi:hypothetical protein